VTDYLTPIELLAIHADLIERYGGSMGIRDRGLLEAALYRPQTGYYTSRATGCRVYLVTPP
jgi:death on curing protein